MEKEKWEEQFDKKFLYDPQSDFDKVIRIISPEINGSSSPIYTTMRAEIKNFIRELLRQEEPTFYRAVVRSPEWQEWNKYAYKRGWDWDESTECGLLSEEHFKAFLDWVRESK
jgi:hypothetical protein